MLTSYPNLQPQAGIVQYPLHGADDRNSLSESAQYTDPLPKIHSQRFPKQVYDMFVYEINLRKDAEKSTPSKM